MNYFKGIIFTLLIASGGNWPLPVQAQDLQDGNAKSVSEIGKLLESQRLQYGEISDVIGDGKGGVRQTDLYGIVNPHEGIPQAGDNGPGTSELLDNAYPSVELIKRAIKKREYMAIGQRIPYMEHEAKHICVASHNRTDEMLMRYVLNRAVDTVSFILPVYGRNTDEVARALSNFYLESFQLAAGYASNRVGLVADVSLGAEYDSAEYLKKISMAEFGRTYAVLLWRYSQSLSSTSSKAILLMRLLTYMGWDMNMDLKRREPGIKMTIYDIYELQQSPQYNNILAALQAGYEPRNADVAYLRMGIDDIFVELPGRLGH